MDDRECITIRNEEYEEMILQYFDALDQMSDLELEVFELKEKLSLLTGTQEREYKRQADHACTKTTTRDETS